MARDETQDKAQVMDFDSELKAKIESCLFCIPEGIELEKLAKKLNLGSVGILKGIMVELQRQYAERKSGVQLICENELWRFKIPDENVPLVRDVALPEMDRGILETLAYIAWRRGSRQCDVVRVRSNKAYNHIKYLLEKEFITSQRSGLSKWLQPTKKFYEYFNLKANEKLKIPGIDMQKLEEEHEKRAEQQKQEEVQSPQQKQEEQQAQQSQQASETKEEKQAEQAEVKDNFVQEQG